eukprot:NODE_349_length_10402_cov_0.251286.p2 type:complete len:652 gc:universal NODE_349_length_10402_cov_0.251286:10048-8093(-)
MEQLRQLFKARDLTSTLKNCKLLLNSSKLSTNLEDVGIEIWNTTIKQKLNPQFKLCAFILFLKSYQDKHDTKSHLKLLAMASRLINELNQADKEYIYQSCLPRLEIVIGMLATKSIHISALDQILSLIFDRLEIGWSSNNLTTSLFLFEKICKIKVTKPNTQQIFNYVIYLYESNPQCDINYISLFVLLNELVPMIHSDTVLVSKFYLYFSIMHYNTNDFESCSVFLVKSTSSYLLLGAMVISLMLPDFICIPIDQFIFECLPGIDMRNEQYSHILDLYNKLHEISVKSANSLLESLINKCRKYPLQCKDIFYKTLLLHFSALIESEDIEQITLFIDDCIENMMQQSLINSICVLLWIKGDELINEMAYENALKYFEPSLRILHTENANHVILKRKICFCKLQMNKLDKKDLTDDLFLQFQYNLTNDQGKCKEILNKIKDLQQPELLVGCASLAFQKEAPELLLMALESMHMCGKVDLCLTRAALRLVVKVNAGLPVIINILRNVDIVDDSKWFFSVIWNLCLKHHEFDPINTFKLLGMNLVFVPDVQQRINTLLFLSSVGCEIIKSNLDEDCSRIVGDIQLACRLIAENEMNELVEIAAQMEFEVYCLFKDYDAVCKCITNFGTLKSSKIIVNVFEHLEDLDVPINGDLQ